MVDKICVCLAGHVAEKLFCGPKEVSSGCSNDLEKATSMAYAMVRQYGMEEEKYGLAAAPKEQMSEDANKKVDEAVQNLLKVSTCDPTLSCL